MIGETLSARYDVVRLLGRGEQSSVWLAHDRELERDVAIKVLEVAHFESPQEIARLEGEARTLAALAHPAIVTVIDLGEHEGVPYIVFEHVGGEPLRAMVARGTMDLPRALAISAQVAEALEYAHKHGVVHRAVSLDTILLTGAGTAKLTDFGIVQALDGEAAEDTAGAREADVEALGAVFFQCLVGEPPARPEDGNGSIAIGQRAAPSACVRRPDLPPDVDAILARALSPRPWEHYPDAGTMAADLEALLARQTKQRGADTAEIPVVASALAPLEPTDPIPKPRTMKRHGRGIARPLAAGALVVAVLGTAFWLIGPLADGDDVSSATPTASTPTGSEDETSTPEVTTTPDAAARTVRMIAASAYDPAGDRSENDASAAFVIDDDGASAWTTERYQATQDANGKGGVGIVLDPGASVRGTAMLVQSPTPGWSGRIYATGLADAPEALAAWRAVSEPFVAGTSRTRVELKGEPGRLYLLWITSLSGEQGSWQTAVSGVRLLAQKR